MQAKLLRCLGVCALIGILLFARSGWRQQRPRPVDPPGPEVIERLPREQSFVESERVHIRELQKRDWNDPNRSKDLWEYSLIPLAPLRNWQEPTPTPEDKAPDIPRRKRICRSFEDGAARPQSPAAVRS
jgi:hypothetical protein